jgi:hypothetical protein
MIVMTEEEAMKRMTWGLLLVFLAFHLPAQSETAAYKSVVETFVSCYNGNRPDLFYDLLSSEMKWFLPLENAKEFLTEFPKQYGKIKSVEFSKYQAGAAVYKTQFDTGVLALYISLDSQAKIQGFRFKPFVSDNLPVLPRNISKLILPFQGEWFVVWGGDTEALNYHVVNPAQTGAYDFLMVDAAGKSFRNSGEKSDDYYCFAAKLIAPCDGQIVLAVDGVKDNKPGEMNPDFPLGNTVILKTNNNEFLYFCHFKQHSIVVTEGQRVKQGQELGRCGNSGRSSEPHLHFHIQNAENMSAARGVKCYFGNISVNGGKKSDYSPVQKEKVKNAGNQE